MKIKPKYFDDFHVGDFFETEPNFISKDEIIENVAEKILTQEKTLAVVDENNQIVGSINPSKIINTVFGGRKNNS